jgi:hypothetical protein
MVRTPRCTAPHFRDEIVPLSLIMSLQSQRSNGHPEPEVIVNVGDNIHLIRLLNCGSQYADGYAYSKSKFEEGLRIVLADKPPKPAKTQSGLKKEDIDLIVGHFKQAG